jgi:hypothetical protein
MPGLLSSSEDLAFMARVTTGDQADTPITPILTGIAGSGGTATGAIGRARRDVGPLSRALSRRSAPAA